MSSVSSEKEFGKDLGVVHEAVITGRKVGADQKFWSTLAHDEEKFRQIVELVNARPTFEVIVHYSWSLKKMIKAGNYDWVNDDITAEHFPIEGQAKQEKTVTLLHFNRSMSSDQVKQEIDKQGFQPAKIEELLALGEKYPDLQKQFPIAALGSVWQDPRGGRGVPCLGWNGARRDLCLVWLGSGWVAYWRFAALRK